jgi:uncharacterized lipoprotein
VSVNRIAIGALISLAPVLLALAGCSREKSVICSRNDAYLAAVEDGPLRVPDGLSVPDEVEALRIPGSASAASQASAQAATDSSCLELSPAFSLPAGQ